MDYLNNLHYKTEPFITSPGDEIFLSQAIQDTIEKLSHYILLGAGPQLIIGSEGFGKTTLLHQLVQKFSADSKTVVLLLNNPQFRNLQQFLITITGVFKTIKPPAGVDDNTFQKAFNGFFYKLCQQEKKTVLLLIDNGHNLPDFCLQGLSSFYDHHPDCRRFLQTVICGEAPVQKKIDANPAISGRIVYTALLRPFNFRDTRKMIEFHLKRVSADPAAPPKLFTIPAQWAIYHFSQGHPKEILDLCHFSTLSLVIEKRKKADWFMVLRGASQLFPKRSQKSQLIRTFSLASLVILMLVFGLWTKQITILNPPQINLQPKMPVASKVEPAKRQPPVLPKVTEQAAPMEQAKEMSSTVEKVGQQEVTTVLPPEEKIVAVTLAQKPAEVPIPPENKPEVTEVPKPEPDAVAIEPPGPQQKPAAKIETIVTPAIRERREVKPGDTFNGLIEQVYGPSYVKLGYIDKVIAANPQLKDPTNLEVGEQIFFPVLAPEQAKPLVAAADQKPRETMVDEHEPPPAAVLASSGKRVEMPQFLGEITTASGENFGDMIRRLYGPYSFNETNVQKVMAVNPNLKSPEQLYVGFKVRFPTIPVALTPEAPEVWWVRITTLDNIQSAYRFLRKFRKSAPPLLIIPSKTANGQIIMNILLEEYFKDEPSSQKAIQTLPPEIAATAEAVHGLDPAIYYYREKQND